MQTAIHLGFSNIPRSLTRAIQPSRHGHRLQKALLLTVPEHLERVARGPQPDPSGVNRIAITAAAFEAVAATLPLGLGRLRGTARGQQLIWLEARVLANSAFL